MNDKEWLDILALHFADKGVRCTLFEDTPSEFELFCHCPQSRAVELMKYLVAAVEERIEETQ
ncbi:MAG TPA: hypothetical protein VF600_08925 [Abditibacteriaceae bacterium]|jgi:hypothetical protein